jgi:hypothetical protein
MRLPDRIASSIERMLNAWADHDHQAIFGSFFDDGRT